MATYQVPVWFNIETDNKEEAWKSIDAALHAASVKLWESDHRVTDWAVDEPEIITTDPIAEPTS